MNSLENQHDRTCFDIVKLHAYNSIPFVKTCLNTTYSCTTNWLKAKINPLSSPPGWEQEKAASQKKIEHLRGLKTQLKRRIHALEDGVHDNGTKLKKNFRIKHPQTSSKKESGSPEEVDHLHKNIRTINEKLEHAKQHNRHLDNVKKTEIAGRFASYAGKTLALIFPTAEMISESSIVADVIPEPTSFVGDHVVKMAAIGTHVRGVRRLSDAHIAEKETSRANRRVFLTAASTVGTLAFLFFFRKPLNDATSKLFELTLETGTSIISTLAECRSRHCPK